MSFLKKIQSALSGGQQARDQREAYPVTVRCRRCGELLTAEIDLRNDLSIDYDSNTYHVRKLIVGGGSNRCFQQIEITLSFDSNRTLIDRQIAGGSFVDEEPVSSS